MARILLQEIFWNRAPKEGFLNQSGYNQIKDIAGVEIHDDTTVS
jgi:hypothetical protein